MPKMTMGIVDQGACKKAFEGFSEENQKLLVEMSIKFKALICAEEKMAALPIEEDVK